MAFLEGEAEQASPEPHAADGMSVEETPQLTARSSLDSASTASTESLHPPHPHGHHTDDINLYLTPQISQNSTSIRPQLSRVATSVRTAATADPNYEVDWEDDDPLHPHNWPAWYRGVVIGFVSYVTLVVVIYSTSYTQAIPGMEVEFHVYDETIVTLGVTTYLVGLGFGSVLLAPLSEIYGRRPVYVGSMLVFFCLVFPCAKATSLATIIVVRFFGALAGSAMISNAPGTVADLSTDDNRALLFSIWSIGPLNGPVFGPIIGGFCAQYLGWRWTNWLVSILAGVAFIMICMVKETYGPAILQKKAAKKRKETGESKWWSRYDIKLKFIDLMKVNLTRPFVMAVTEPICIFWNLYIAVIYGILYLAFIAYPIVFSQERGWSESFSGLSFLGIGVGSFLVIICEPLFRRVILAHARDPETHRPYPEASVSIVCLAAILAPVGELWFAWTCSPRSIHWIWSILAGIPFGAGNTACFIYSQNYIAGSYGRYAASALAGNAVVRSFSGGTLPLAGPSMYATLGANWAGTLLGLLEVILIPIPFVFYKWGHKIRAKSALISSMQQEKLKLDSKRARALEKANRQAAAAANGNTAVDPEKCVPTTEYVADMENQSEVQPSVQTTAPGVEATDMNAVSAAGEKFPKI